MNFYHCCFIFFMPHFCCFYDISLASKKIEQCNSLNFKLEIGVTFMCMCCALCVWGGGCVWVCPKRFKNHGFHDWCLV